jgi:hypothetical protein
MLSDMRLSGAPINVGHGLPPVYHCLARRPIREPLIALSVDVDGWIGGVGKLRARALVELLERFVRLGGYEIHLVAPQNIEDVATFDDVVDGLANGAGNVVLNLDAASFKEEVEVKDRLVVLQLD